MIEIRNLTVKYGGVVALDDLTLTVQDAVTGLIGPNGAGKTTLTNALSGFAPITAGSVLADGVDLLALAPHRRACWGLARSFQKVQIVEDLTVEQHLLAVLEAKRIARADRTAHVTRALDFCGIPNTAQRRGAELNPFDRRMAEIAKCLVGTPKIILLDEPGGGLSEQEMQHLRQVITGIDAVFGAQVVLVDHDVDLIRDVCAATAVLDFGRLIAFGPTDEVLRDEVVKTAYLGR